MFTQSPISPQHLCCHVILSYPLILPTRGEICLARDNNNNVVCAGGGNCENDHHSDQVTRATNEGLRSSQIIPLLLRLYAKHCK